MYRLSPLRNGIHDDVCCNLGKHFSPVPAASRPVLFRGKNITFRYQYYACTVVFNWLNHFHASIKGKCMHCGIYDSEYDMIPSLKWPSHSSAHTSCMFMVAIKMILPPELSYYFELCNYS